MQTPLVLRVDRRCSTIVFWTCLEGLLPAGTPISDGIALLLQRHGLHGFTGQPAFRVIGALGLLFTQIIYPWRARLLIDRGGLVLSAPFRVRRMLRWDAIAWIDSVSALTPAGPGGNQSGLFLRNQEGRLLTVIPDVFELPRDTLSDQLRGRLVPASTSVSPPVR